MKTLITILLIAISLNVFSSEAVNSKKSIYQMVLESESQKEDDIAEENIKLLDKIKTQKELIYKTTKKDYKSQVVMTEYHTNYNGYTLPRSDHWFGLYCETGECKLIQTELEIRAMPLISFDEVELADIPNVEGKPISLIHGVPLAEGNVSTTFISEYSGMPINFSSDREEKNFWKVPGVSDLSIIRERISKTGGFKYYIKHGKFKQLLIESHPSNMDEDGVVPELRWVGDLDRDGSLDLIFNLSSYCFYHNRLYLSNQLSKDQLYSAKTAIDFSGLEVACGC